MPRRLAVVVVNYASTRLLEINLAVVQEAARSIDARALVVVVDNWSSDEERRAVRRVAAERGWELVQNAENFGFGVGSNAGIERAWVLGATDVMLINPDARIDEQSLRRLAEVSAEDRMSLLSPVVLSADGRPWFAGVDLLLADGTMRAWRKRPDGDDSPYESWLSGACLWITRDVWELVGGFDDEYFLYWEDVDFSHRLVAVGGRLRLVADAQATHVEGGTQREKPETTRAKSDAYYYYNIRNRMLFAVRHLDEATIQRWTRAIPRTAREVILRGGRRQFFQSLVPVRAYIRGVRDARYIAKHRGLPPTHSGGSRAGL